ncbi:putative serine O-acetyltransferase [Leptospira inadai serovar Lyme str. 10]|uniref:Serine acetyltransferase n=2 Tax=Leptospira inadai serovar Lyme TaxID=293084 RepID=V6HA10_9LEPT|nr:serine O-acetyltransferase EpsC [Leptospira inadai]EQA35902.1 putative serine O-acetyltransferase [Leptospira inadai serovar Lyme str. 10]PNV76970.1 serine acetyltransferase [Leptospira inadai serovar Lyme]
MSSNAFNRASLQNQSEKQQYRNFLESIYQKQNESTHQYGGRRVARDFIQELFNIIFAGYFSDLTFRDIAQVEDSIALFMSEAKDKLQPYLLSTPSSTTLNLNDVLADFQNNLPNLYELIWQDALAAYEGDPAAESVKEVILAYPGFYAIAVHRIANVLHGLGVPIFPRMLSEYAHEKTGIDIHPGAKIGRSFFMDHGTGIVIGGTSIIANNVKIYQGVTLGALSVSKSMAQLKRHPTIEENVIIYAGATILGGDTVIGRNSIIGGNAWLTQSVPSYSIVNQKNEVRVRNSQELNNVIDFSI